MNINIFGINFEDKPEESTKILDNNYLTIKEVEKKSDGKNTCCLYTGRKLLLIINLMNKYI